MKTISVLLLAAFLTAAPLFAGDAGKAPSVGGKMPAFSLTAPADAAGAAYLGLTPGEEFALDRVAAPVVIVQIFSMYCPHCQREAPVVNDFYRLLASDPRTADRVKLVGIGIGNSDFEIGHYRKKYQVPFPLFADGDYRIHKLLGEVRTPYFIGLQSGSDGQRVFHSRLGGFGTPEEFLERIVEKTASGQ